jgi:hypothetical protein
MQWLHTGSKTGYSDIHLPRYDGEKLSRIREKIKIVFGGESSMDDVALSKRYNITSDGELILILK